MRTIDAYLVTEVVALGDGIFVDSPMFVFQDVEEAHKFADEQDADSVEEPVWHFVRKIEVVLDD